MIISLLIMSEVSKAGDVGSETQDGVCEIDINGMSLDRDEMSNWGMHADDVGDE